MQNQTILAILAISGSVLNHKPQTLRISDSEITKIWELGRNRRVNHRDRENNMKICWTCENKLLKFKI